MQDTDQKRPEHEAELPHCGFGDLGYCVTCSDEAIPARVVSIVPETGMAVVLIGEETVEVDVMLVEHVSPDEWVFVHGGVAIAKLEEGHQ